MRYCLSATDVSSCCRVEGRGERGLGEADPQISNKFQTARQAPQHWWRHTCLILRVVRVVRVRSALSLGFSVFRVVCLFAPHLAASLVCFHRAFATHVLAHPFNNLACLFSAARGDQCSFILLCTPCCALSLLCCVSSSFICWACVCVCVCV